MLHRRKFCTTFFALLLTVCMAGQAGAIHTSAASAVLIEQKSGRVLYEQSADDERLIASITKIMTALVALEHGQLQKTYTVTEADLAEGSSMYLKPGESLRLEELLYGLMLVSGNDAALAVAHCVSGELEDFVELMNETAGELGMTHSHFANPNGLDAEGHYSSARDMAVLAAYACGVVHGDPDGAFRPLSGLSRAEACTLFQNAFTSGDLEYFQTIKRCRRYASISKFRSRRFPQKNTIPHNMRKNNRPDCKRYRGGALAAFIWRLNSKTPRRPQGRRGLVYLNFLFQNIAFFGFVSVIHYFKLIAGVGRQFSVNRFTESVYGINYVKIPALFFFNL